MTKLSPNLKNLRLPLERDTLPVVLHANLCKDLPPLNTDLSLPEPNLQIAVIEVRLIPACPAEHDGKFFDSYIHGKRLCHIVYRSQLIPGQRVLFQIPRRQENSRKLPQPLFPHPLYQGKSLPSGRFTSKRSSEDARSTSLAFASASECASFVAYPFFYSLCMIP